MVKSSHALSVVGRSQAGAALPFALLGLLLISALAFALVSLGGNEITIATNWRAYNTALYGAEAGIEAGLVDLRDLLQKTPCPPCPTAQELAAIQAPALTDSTLQFAAYSVAYANQPPPAGAYQTTFTSGPFSGLFGTVTDYRITSQVTGAGGTRANLTQIVKFVQVPLFQFGVFYGKGVDLEMAPAPPMTWNGRIFSNSNIYIGTKSTLTLQSTMKTAGNISRTIKSFSNIPFNGGNGPPQSGQDPVFLDASGNPHSLNFDHQYKPGFTSGLWASVTDWVNKAQSTFGDQVQDGAMGVTQITLPVPGMFDNPANPDVVAHQLIEMTQGSDSPALQSAKLYSQAGVRIIQQLDGSISTFDQNGSPVTLPAGTVTTTESFWDAREGKTVKVIQVDVGKLNPAKPANGLLYVASKLAPTSSMLPAVRLVNGSALPSSGLTVVSQNPVYVQGDYNTVKSGPDPNHPPAAIMADAITVLSNNWGPNGSDAKGSQVATNRPATATTVNAALALGPGEESTMGNGNGQLENVIRHLETWNNTVPFTYSGSIVALWHSTQAKGKWQCCGQYYSPPIRNWSYDTLFNTNPPPGTPFGILMNKGQWSQS